MSKSLSLAFSIFCAVLSGTLMFLARTASAPLWLVLVLICLLTVFLFFASVLFRPQVGRYQRHKSGAFGLQECTVAATALCFFAAALLHVPQFLRDTMIFSLLPVVGALIAALACGFRLLVGESHPRSAPCAMIPVFFLCAQLMIFYRANSYHPDTEAFGYEIVVLALLLMGVFFTASGKYKPRTAMQQRFWALLPLAGYAMELCMLLFRSQQLYLAQSMNTATLLGMTGAAMLLIAPLSIPVRPVVLQVTAEAAAPAEPEATPTAAAEETPEEITPETKD